jgi:uncharacterized protein DUF2782
MRIISRFALLGMIIGSALAVAAPQDAKAPLKSAPPPPGINDPGVTAAPAAKTQDAAAAPAASADDTATDPLAPLPKPDTRLVRDKADRDGTTVQRRMAASEHVTRTQDGDTVDEYRENGKVWMIHIVPQNGGPDSTFMDTNGTGRLTRDPNQGPVSPVYFSLYDWN